MNKDTVEFLGFRFEVTTLLSFMAAMLSITTVVGFLIGDSRAQLVGFFAVESGMLTLLTYQASHEGVIVYNPMAVMWFFISSAMLAASLYL